MALLLLLIKSTSRKRFIGKREVAIVLTQGASTAEACRRIAVGEQAYYRWRKEYGGLNTDQAQRMKDLEKENQRLRRAISDLTLDKWSCRRPPRGTSEPRAATALHRSCNESFQSRCPNDGSCRVLGQHRSTQRKVPRGADEQAPDEASRECLALIVARSSAIKTCWRP